MTVLCNVRCVWPEQRQSIQRNDSLPLFLPWQSLEFCTFAVPFRTLSVEVLSLPHPFVPFVAIDRGLDSNGSTRPSSANPRLGV